jgi:hypothetical protein
MCKKMFLLLCLASYAGSFLSAQGNAKSNTGNPCDTALADAQLGLGNGDTKSVASNPIGKPCSVSWTMPVWSEIVNLSWPAGYYPVYENTLGGHYMIELVPKGETVHQWSQMITVTGGKGLSANPNLDEIKFSYTMVSGFKGACPDTFSSQPIGPAKISGHDAYVAWASCGTVKPDGSGPRGEGGIHSESALIVTIHGTNDYYTVQWAERGSASSQPLLFDSAKWAERLQKLNPIKVCPIVPGEAAPYPSCADKKPITSISTIKPIFSELVSYSYPSGFYQGSESTKSDRYMIEMLPDGEPSALYSQKIVVIGNRGFSAYPNMSALKGAQLRADGFKGACPDTYSSREISLAKVNGHDAYIEWAGCGSVKYSGGVRSESSLIVSIQGKEDNYLIQWGERGPASSQPIVYDKAKWEDRLKKLIPIKICPLVPGEHEPYSSCVNQK